MVSPLLEGCGVIHRGDNLSVHSPIWLKLQVGDLPLKKQTRTRNIKKPSWSKADKEQVYNYTSTLQEKLQAIQVPLSLNCQDVHCQRSEHSVDRDNMVVDILTAVVETSYTALPLYGSKGGGRGNKSVPGWVADVRPFQEDARYWHGIWVQEGKPRGNWLHGLMIKKRSQYHYAVRRAKGKADLCRAEHLFEASLLGDCNLLSEMKKIRCGSSDKRADLPDIVGGAHGEEQIAAKFKEVYQTLYNSASTDKDITELSDKIDGLISQDSIEEVNKVTGAKVKEAACQLKPKKGDISGGFTSDAILNAPNILFDQIAGVFRSFLIHGYCHLLPSGLLLSPLIEGHQGPDGNQLLQGYRGLQSDTETFRKSCPSNMGSSALHRYLTVWI